MAASVSGNDRGRGRAARAGLAVAAALGVWGLAAPAVAQSGAGSASGGSTAVAADPGYVNLAKLTRRITIDLSDQRLEDVINFIAEVTQAEIEPHWRTDSRDGLDREARITLTAKNMPALTLLERVLEKAQTDFAQNTWQLTSYGSVEIGPKDVLNRRKRLVIYDVNDLLTELPRFYDAPQIDLQGVLQQSQGGGGQSPFTNIQDERRSRDEEEQDRRDRIERLIDLIQTFVETEQWQDNGGDGGTIRYFQGALLVNAPDYIHRQIGGYTFWPTRQTYTNAAGRRYVSLGMDVGISKIDGFALEPVTAVVGGRLVPSNPGGGGNTGKPGEGQKPGDGGVPKDGSQPKDGGSSGGQSDKK